MKKKIYTANQAAKILNLNPQTLYRLAKQGKIEYFKIGGSVRFVLPDTHKEQRS